MIFILRLLGVLFLLLSPVLWIIKKGDFALFAIPSLIVALLLLLSSMIVAKVWARRGDKLTREWQQKMRRNPEYLELQKKRKLKTEDDSTSENQDNADNNESA